MCGIVAFFSRRRPMSEAVLQRATERLNHRGPDGQRHWMSKDRRVGLGHARLSIIDLTGGDQPIASEDGLTPATLNAEEKLHALVQDQLRGSAFASIPFFDQKKVIGLLDGLHAMDEGARVATDPILMILVSACVLQERFQLAA